MYDLNFTEQGNLKLHVRKFLLYPAYWKSSSHSITTHLAWKRVKFNKQNLGKVPARKGVYCFVVVPYFREFFEARYLFYVGKTTRTLQDRFEEYLSEQAGSGKPRKKVFEMLRLYSEHLYFYYASVESNGSIAECETKLIDTFVPHVNTEIPKAKIKPELKYVYE